MSKRKWTVSRRPILVAAALVLLGGAALEEAAAAEDSQASGKDLVLAAGGKSNYRIVVAVDASIQDYHAAEVLQRYLKEMTGAELQIVGDDNALGDLEIIVGFNRHTRTAAPDLKRTGFGKEGFRIKTVGRRLIIVGGSPRGVLYGVNSLLTDEFGCQWFTPLVRRIPKQKSLTLKPVDRSYEPPFEWRDAYFWSGGDDEWAFHNFQNKDFAKLRPEQGWRGGLSHGFSVHTAHELVPPKRYLKANPDYFWVGGDEEPRSNAWAKGKKWIGLCLTHPDVVKIAARSLLEAHRRGGEGDLYYSISSMDNADWCECPRCRAWHRRELGGELPGDSGGWAHGALWLDFAARVREELKDEAEAPKLSVLAYGYAPVPPSRPVMHKDLNVFYAELAVSQFHRLDDPDNGYNKTFRRRLAGWLKCADSVYVWLYQLNFSRSWYFIHPNMHTLADDFRYLRKLGVKGVFAQGNQNAWWGNRFGGEMNELRAYLVARLLWDPDLDWRKERREFCAAYYGAKAGAVIEQYLDDVQGEFAKRDVQGPATLMGDKTFSWITPELYARWYGYMDKAESLAVDEEHKKLVRIARLPIEFTQGYHEKDAAKRKALLQAFLDKAKSLGAASLIGENSAFVTWAKQQGLKW